MQDDEGKTLQMMRSKQSFVEVNKGCSPTELEVLILCVSNRANILLRVCGSLSKSGDLSVFKKIISPLQ